MRDRGRFDHGDDSARLPVDVDARTEDTNVSVSVGSVGSMRYRTGDDAETHNVTNDVTDVLVALGVDDTGKQNVAVVGDRARDHQRLIVAEESRTAEGTPGDLGTYLATEESHDVVPRSSTDDYRPVLPGAGETVDLDDGVAWHVDGDDGGALVVDDRAITFGVDDDAAEAAGESLPEDVDVVATVTDKRLVVGPSESEFSKTVGVDLADTDVGVVLTPHRFDATVDHPESNGVAAVAAAHGEVTVSNVVEHDARTERANVAGVDLDIDHAGSGEPATQSR